MNNHKQVALNFEIKKGALLTSEGLTFDEVWDAFYPEFKFKIPSLQDPRNWPIEGPIEIEKSKYFNDLDNYHFAREFFDFVSGDKPLLTGWTAHLAAGDFFPDLLLTNYLDKLSKKLTYFTDEFSNPLMTLHNVNEFEKFNERSNYRSIRYFSFYHQSRIEAYTLKAFLRELAWRWSKNY